MATDEELLRQVQERSAAALEELMERHRPAIRAAVLRIVRDPAAGDDLVQEVFLRLWTRAEQFSGQGSVRGWILRIGANLALNHLRSVRRRRCQPLGISPPEGGEGPEPQWLVDAAAQRPDELAELAERREMLRQMIEQLPDEKRELLEMVFEQRLRVCEAAERLGIPGGTAKSRLHYAVKALLSQWRRVQRDTED